MATLSKLPFRKITEMEGISGKRVLVCASLDVPLVNGEVLDGGRLEAILPTIRWLSERGAKVILVGKLGKGEISLRPVADYLQKFLKIDFVPDLLGDLAKMAVEKMSDGEVLLLENLRNFRGEVENDLTFAKEVAKLGDFYVNEAFPVSHREHASIVSIPKFLPSFAGLQFEKEYTELSQLFSPTKPFLVILGGAKFATKLPVVESFVESADFIFVGGALGNDLLAARGFSVGHSLVSDFSLPQKIIQSEKIIAPIDVRLKSGEQTESKEVPPDGLIVDAGDKTTKYLKNLIAEMKTVLWNGPLGRYEDGNDVASLEILKTLAEQKDLRVILGGGDTLALIAKAGLDGQFSFVSTAGGAMLSFLTEETLPGIRALAPKKS